MPTTSKLRYCPNCMYPVRVRFVLQDNGKTWSVVLTDPGKPGSPVIVRCPVCKLDLYENDIRSKLIGLSPTDGSKES